MSGSVFPSGRFGAARFLLFFLIVLPARTLPYGGTVAGRISMTEAVFYLLCHACGQVHASRRPMNACVEEKRAARQIG